jgi:hypothetical protein
MAWVVGLVLAVPFVTVLSYLDRRRDQHWRRRAAVVSTALVLAYLLGWQAGWFRPF